ncbi:SLC13 family permease [Bradyrhizobium manausense]|uniref:SLC13 family permease n=1 Tax=Bradyrhizobium manausense TaxID=989370 RepID=UPI001BAD4562|nr:DASS family sodium-coupled anion symporter [Bradyrhizobium manausense]MBR0724235.1 DASS family sodium-coupled anion symporter [Bradyrhizobium manausense]
MSSVAHAPPTRSGSVRNYLLVLLGLAMMAAIALAPAPVGLSLVGQRVLAVMAFIVFMWITEAIPYGVSAIALIFLLIVSLGFSPTSGVTGEVLGTGKAIPLALSGFSNSGWLFVAAGLAMAAAITSTSLEKRVAYLILKLVGTKTPAIMAGIIVTAFALTFIIPSVIARAATLVPIVIGLIEAFGVKRDSHIGKAMLLLAGILPSVTGVGVLTGAAPNPVIVNFLSGAGQMRVTYVDWLVYLLPYTIVFSIGLYFLVTRLFKFEFAELPGGADYINSRLAEMGPMTASEKKASVIMAMTIILWATDKLHHVEASAISVLCVLLLVMPNIGVIACNDLYKRVDWNSILLFGAGISMAEMFTKTGGAAWLSKVAFVDSGMGALSVTMLAIMIFVVVFFVRFCFTSITSCLTAITPAILGFLVALHNPAVPIVGIVLGVSLIAQCQAIIPVTSAPAMIAYGAGGFTTRDMIKLGIPLAILMYVLIVLWMFTYWPLVGL